MNNVFKQHKPAVVICLSLKEGSNLIFIKQDIFQPESLHFYETPILALEEN